MTPHDTGARERGAARPTCTVAGQRDRRASGAAAPPTPGQTIRPADQRSGRAAPNRGPPAGPATSSVCFDRWRTYAPGPRTVAVRLDVGPAGRQVGRRLWRSRTVGGIRAGEAERVRRHG